MFGQQVSHQPRRLGVTTHGLSRTKVYSVWKSMMHRCYNEKCKEYKYYGQRGIKVCDRWHDVTAFVEDMGHPPPGMWIERKDNDGHYEKDNCCWETKKNQLRNRSDNLMITAFGRTQCLAAWAEEYGMRSSTLWKRIVRDGFSSEEAMTTPLRRKNVPLPCAICGSIFQPKSTKRSKLCGKPECRSVFGRLSNLKRGKAT